MNSNLQQIVVNVTHHAIAQSASNYGISRSEFRVDFYDVSGSMTIEQDLCAFTGPTMNILQSVIVNEGDEVTIEENLCCTVLNAMYCRSL